MSKVIIADTSCLIILNNINLLDILNDIFGDITITPEVKSEFNQKLPNWIKVAEVKDKVLLQNLLVSLDKGEASSIALGIEEKKKVLLIIDEKKGRAVAKKFGLNIIGTIGVILKAKKENKIKSVKEVIMKLESSDFRISKELLTELSKLQND